MKTKNILITIGIIVLVLIIGGGVALFFAFKSASDFVSKNSSSIASQLNSATNSLASSTISSINNSVSSSSLTSGTSSAVSISSSSSVALVPADAAGEALIRASVDAIDGAVKSGDYDTFTKYVDLKSITKAVLNADSSLDKTTKEIANTYFDQFYAEQEATIREDFSQGDAGLFNASKNQSYTVKKAGADYVVEVLNPDSVSNIPYRMFFRLNSATSTWQMYQILGLDGKAVTDIS